MIIQLSAEVVRIDLSRVKAMTAHDKLFNATHGDGLYNDANNPIDSLFNEYANLGPDAK